MSDIKMEDIVDPIEPTSDSIEQVDQSTDPDPLKTELERVQKKSGKTEREKALFTKAQIEKRLKELDEEEGVDSTPPEDEDVPVTVGMLKKIQAENATKTALQLAEDIETESERELTKYHIQNSIKPTGNPKEDLRLARAITNAAKNQQVMEEIARKNPAKTHSNSSGAPAKFEAPEAELSKDEIAFMRPPFNLTKEQILKSRKAQ